MKHYADEKNSKSAPRYNAKSTGGKRYATPENRSRYEAKYRRDRFEKKPTELRIKHSEPRVTDTTKVYPVKKSDMNKLKAAGYTFVILRLGYGDDLTYQDDNLF